MRYIKFSGGTDYRGTDYEEVNIYPDDVTDECLNDEAITIAENNAESYEYLVNGGDNDFQSEEERAAYYEGVWCNWQEISEKEYKELEGK